MEIRNRWAAPWAVGWMALQAFAACNAITVSRLGRPCDGDGTCPSEPRQSWVCHPELATCVPELPVGCPSQDGQLCPTDVATGTPCSSPTAYIPCAEGVADCSLGCRTCGDDFTWSECSGECTLGQLTSCGSCADDCSQSIAHATPLCDTSASADPQARVNGNRCDYAGYCESGWVDGDGNRQNGCEAATCILGQVNTCHSCSDNCAQTILHAVVVCDTSASSNPQEVGNSNRCDYAGACETGWADSDGDRLNGCEAATCALGQVASCSSCGEDCTPLVLNATAVCNTSASSDPQSATNGNHCDYAGSCAGGWADSDGDRRNGCETDVTQLPAGVVTDFLASDNEDGQATITFTKPTLAVACKVIRRQDRLPTNHTDGTPIGGEVVAGFVDTGLTNGFTYYYAVFCRSGATYADDPVASGANADTAVPSACQGSGTFDLALRSAPTCSDYATSGTQQMVVMHLTVTTSCNNSLTRLTIDNASSSTTAPGELANAFLFVNAPPITGVPGLEDGPLVGPVAMNGAITFSGFAIPISGSSVLTVTADVAAGAGRSLYAPRIAALSSFAVSDAVGVTRSLTPTPLAGGLISLGDRICTGAPADLGVGTQIAPRVRSWYQSGNAGGWDLLSELGWNIVATDDNGAQTADCDLDTSGGLIVSDDGKLSRFLHVNTGVPTDLPVCSGPTLRIYGTSTPSAGSCTNRVLAGAFASVRAYVYTSDTAVDPTLFTFSIPATLPAQTTGAGNCAESFDIDLSGVYARAVAVGALSPLNVRLVFEKNGNINTAPTPVPQTSISALFVRVP